MFPTSLPPAYMATAHWTCCQVRFPVALEADAAAPGNTEEAEAFATANGLPYFEASAKDHESVDVVLRNILHLGPVRPFLLRSSC